MQNPDTTEMVEVTRGGLVESIHNGAAVVVDTAGKIIAWSGAIQTKTFLRSAAKPFQALPFIENGGAEYFNLSEREIALICSSHSGTDEHLRVVQGIQEKIGITEGDLLCGTHTPFHEATARALICHHQEPTPNRHNCSGKHSGMLAHAIQRGLPKANYVAPDHPLQKIILQSFAEMSALAPDQITVGIDGCSVPTFAIPLYNAALAYARLADPQRLPSPRAAALNKIRQAMTGHPDMVAGPGRFDTHLMKLMGGGILAKIGAEGYEGMAIQAGLLGSASPALGVAFKIADGDNGGRARTVVAIEILRQFGFLSADQITTLAEFDARPVYNLRHLEIGEIRPVFRLHRG